MCMFLLLNFPPFYLLQSLDKNCLGPLRKAYCISLNLLLRREVSKYKSSLASSWFYICFCTLSTCSSAVKVVQVYLYFIFFMLRCILFISSFSPLTKWGLICHDFWFSLWFMMGTLGFSLYMLVKWIIITAFLDTYSMILIFLVIWHWSATSFSTGSILHNSLLLIQIKCSLLVLLSALPAQEEQFQLLIMLLFHWFIVIDFNSLLILKKKKDFNGFNFHDFLGSLVNNA